MLSALQPYIFQSTLPREERQKDSFKRIIDFIISIHAPTRGATSEFKLMTEEQKISIHAPTRGATGRIMSNYEYLDFNPRSHERSDYNYNILNNICDISIHAPTRGATAHALGALGVYEFQSTLPREERLIATMHKTVV